MRLIDADALLEEFGVSDCDIAMRFLVRFLVEDTPTIDVAPVVHSNWIPLTKSEIVRPIYRCNNCKEMVSDLMFKYCPHCGARMDGDKE